MSIVVGDNFSYQGGKPLDARFQFATVAAMKAYAESSLYNGCFAYVTGTKEFYVYDSSNTVDSTTGRWRIFEGGGSGASSLSDLDDTTISSPSNGQVLSYNGSKWVNGSVPSDSTKQPKTLDTPLTIDGAQVTSVEGALGTLSSGKQPKTLATPITIAGTSYTTVESALSALNTISSETPGYAYMFSGGTTVSDFEADIKAHYYHDDSIFYGDFIIFYTMGYGGVTFTNNCPDGSSVTTRSYTIYCRCTNPDGIVGGNLISIVCFSNDELSTNKTCKVYQKKMGRNSGGSWTENYWIALESGGSSNAYSPDDTASTDLADADYVPFYDTSASAKKKSLWSNIKSVLKTYFDSLYNPLMSNTTELAKINEQSGNPTYDGKIISLPTIHNFDKNNLYDATEKVIGKWTDGRPLYQRTYTGTYPSASGGGVSGNLFAFSYDVKNVVGFLRLTTGSVTPVATDAGYIYCLNGYVSCYYTNTAYAGATYNITLQYTKSTDSANSFNYASENDYSTSETIIGTWLNGETLYQRTYSSTTGNKGTDKNVGTLPSYAKITKIDGSVCTDATSQIYTPLAYTSLSSSYSSSNYISCYIMGTAIYVVHNSTDWQNKSVWVTIQYTKS